MTDALVFLIKRHLKVDNDTATSYASAFSKICELGTAISSPPEVSDAPDFYPRFLTQPPPSIYGGLVVFNSKRDVDALDRIAASVQEIASALNALTGAARLEMSTDLGFGEFRSVESSEDHRAAYFEGIGNHTSSAIDYLEIFQDQILKSLAVTKSKILNSSNSSAVPERIGLQAASVVDIAIAYWKLHVQENVPKKQLNTATQLASFLSELFDALGIEADVRSAYASWAKLKNT